MAKPRKLTPQQENFARHIVRGYSQAEAYRRSYSVGPRTKPTTVWVESCKLAADPKVSQRITELTAQAAARAGVTRETMLAEMGFNRERAVDAGDNAAANTASRDRARVAGLLSDKLELTGKDGAAIAVKEEVSLEDRSINEIARRIAFTLQKGRRVKSGSTPAK